MTELRDALQRLVDHAPAAPPPVEVVAARGARFTRRRRLLRVAASLGVLAGSSATALVATRDASDPAEIVLTTEGPGTAGYIAEGPGGYVATGTWRLTITRGREVIELHPPSSGHCGETGTIQPGDEVRGSITGSDSSLRVGETFACPDGRSGAGAG